MSNKAFAVLLITTFIVAFANAQAEGQAKYNERIGKKWLAENKEKDGVVTTASGLQYKVLKSGSGTVHPAKSDQVKVHYRGTLTNGKEFDSSYSRGQPATFGVGQVIAGWTEALQLMVVGDEWEVYIPSDLAYGARGAGKDIGPNSALVFKVELLEIVGSGATGAAGKPAKKTKPKREREEL